MRRGLFMNTVFKNFFLIYSLFFVSVLALAEKPLNSDQEQHLEKESSSFFSSFLDVFNRTSATEECDEEKKARLTALEVQGLESVFSSWRHLFSTEEEEKADKIKVLQRAAEIGPPAVKVVEMAMDDNQFIFKGELLLFYYITLGRETRDVDLQTTQLNLRF